jgi:hypothetical protein
MVGLPRHQSAHSGRKQVGERECAFKYPYVGLSG